jgi:hypothetical protein
MERRRRFALLCSLSVATLAIWSAQLSSVRGPGPGNPGTVPTRQQLLETLDRIVTYEGYFRSVYGSYTRILGQLGVEIPPPLLQGYAIHVQEVTPDRIRVSAVAEANGQVSDWFTLDQDYQLYSASAAPPPRLEYLKAVAIKKLRRAREDPATLAEPEPSVYRGYFQYQLRSDSEGRPVAIAFGVRSPALSVRIELEPRGVRIDGASHVPSEPGFAPDPVLLISSLSAAEVPPETIPAEAKVDPKLAREILLGETGSSVAGAEASTEVIDSSASPRFVKSRSNAAEKGRAPAQVFPRQKSPAAPRANVKRIARGGLVIEPITPDN